MVNITNEQLQLISCVNLRKIAGVPVGKYNKAQLIDKIINKEKLEDKFITLRISCGGVVSVVEKNTTTTTIQKEEESKYYSLNELFKRAKKAGIKYYRSYSRKQLCELLNVEFKDTCNTAITHTLTNVKTGVVEEFKTTNSILKKFGIGIVKIYYAVETGNPLVVDGVSYIVTKKN